LWWVDSWVIALRDRRHVEVGRGHVRVLASEMVLADPDVVVTEPLVRLRLVEPLVDAGLLLAVFPGVGVQRLRHVAEGEESELHATGAATGGARNWARP